MSKEPCDVLYSQQQWDELIAERDEARMAVRALVATVVHLMEKAKRKR